jgi:hypothetical protein
VKTVSHAISIKYQNNLVKTLALNFNNKSFLPSTSITTYDNIKIFFSVVCPNFQEKWVCPSQGIDTSKSYSQTLHMITNFTCGLSPREPTPVLLHHQGEKGGPVTPTSLDRLYVTFPTPTFCSLRSAGLQGHANFQCLITSFRIW